jgi:hypothetical protein
MVRNQETAYGEAGDETIPNLAHRAVESSTESNHKATSYEVATLMQPIGLRADCHKQSSISVGALPQIASNLGRLMIYPEKVYLLKIYWANCVDP